jgi:hypothetical protein
VKNLPIYTKTFSLSNKPTTSAPLEWKTFGFLSFPVYIDCLLLPCDVSCIVFEHFKMLFLLLFFASNFMLSRKKSFSVSFPFENGTPNFFLLDFFPEKRRVKLRRKCCMENQVDDVVFYFLSLFRENKSFSWETGKGERASAPRWQERAFTTLLRFGDGKGTCGKKGTAREKFSCE